MPRNKFLMVILRVSPAPAAGLSVRHCDRKNIQAFGGNRSQSAYAALCDRYRPGVLQHKGSSKKITAVSIGLGGLIFQIT